MNIHPIPKLQNSIRHKILQYLIIDIIKWHKYLIQDSLKLIQKETNIRLVTSGCVRQEVLNFNPAGNHMHTYFAQKSCDQRKKNNYYFYCMYSFPRKCFVRDGLCYQLTLKTDFYSGQKDQLSLEINFYMRLHYHLYKFFMVERPASINQF